MKEENWPTKRERLLQEGYDPIFIEKCDFFIRKLDSKIEEIQKKRRQNIFCIMRDLFHPK